MKTCCEYYNLDCTQGDYCPLRINQANRDDSDPDSGWADRVQYMAFTGIRVVAVLIIAASLVGLGVGLRSVGWL